MIMGKEEKSVDELEEITSAEILTKEDPNDKELDTILKLFDEKRTTKVFNAIDLALNDVVNELKPTPYEVEVALKLIDLKLKDLETRSAIAGMQEAETYKPEDVKEEHDMMYK